jgi:hypothetical protein
MQLKQLIGLASLEMGVCLVTGRYTLNCGH